MPIRVLSFDFDGCIFNDGYIQAKHAEKNVIKYNQLLLKTMLFHPATDSAKKLETMEAEIERLSK